MQKTEKNIKIFIWIFVFLILISVGFTAYKTLILKDFEIIDTSNEEELDENDVDDLKDENL